MREDRIKFTMNYCQHYGRGANGAMVCKAGLDREAIQVVQTTEKGMKWGPCIEGHLLQNPTEHCPHWLRNTREMGEKRADDIEQSMKRMEILEPVLSAWRAKLPRGKEETIECPVCKLRPVHTDAEGRPLDFRVVEGQLHLSQSSYNGHVSGKCSTEGCVSWIE